MRLKILAIENVGPESDSYDLDSGHTDLRTAIGKIASPARYADCEIPAPFRPDERLLRDVAAWIASGLKFEANACTRLHMLKEDLMITARELGVDPRMVSNFLDVGHPFVMKRDWAAILGPGVLQGEFRLPFDHCVFEFRITGKSVLVVAAQHESSVTIRTCIELDKARWLLCGNYDAVFDPLEKFVTTQIRAMCVALEADAGTRQASRASTKLNEKRTGNDRPPISDYYVVELSKIAARSVSTGESGTSGTTGKIRLHFRRGHYRQVSTKKIWGKVVFGGKSD